jgi:hypothetical protein
MENNKECQFCAFVSEVLEALSNAKDKQSQFNILHSAINHVKEVVSEESYKEGYVDALNEQIDNAIENIKAIEEEYDCDECNCKS